MPSFLFILTYMSIVVYRRAKRAGRGGIRWVGFLWIASFAAGMLFGMLARGLLVSATYELLLVVTALGVLLGIILTTVTASSAPLRLTVRRGLERQLETSTTDRHL